VKRSFALLFSAALAGCAHGATTATAEASAASVAAENPGSSSDGATVYLTNCSSCHGADGRGLPGMFPPLAHNPMVTGDPRRVIATVANGLDGRIVVSGAAYDGVMPAWRGEIPGQQIADVVTYVRGSWGNRAAGVTIADVQSVK
jgi:mono/diheme cytochrome c family protein